jgi:5-methylcytosine-specific restriction endonuclease McrA
MKTCIACKKDFPKTLEYFYKKGNYLTSECKVCNKKRVKARSKANPERENTRNKIYRDTNSEKEKIRHIIWRKNNLEKSNEYKKNWRKINSNKVKEEYRRSNHKRRALILDNGHIPYTEEQVLKTYGTNCNICKIPVDLKAARQVGQPGWENGLHIDHLIPISKGGPDTLENVRPTHGLCNITKHNKENYENQTA